MKNDEIIAEIAVSVYGEDAVQEMIREGKEIPMHSMKGWEKRGFRIKAGEQGVETKLWKKPLDTVSPAHMIWQVCGRFSLRTGPARITCIICAPPCKVAF